MENLEFKSDQKPAPKASFLSKLPKFARSPKILVYALLLLSLPTSVLLVKTVQDIRQRASSLPATPPLPPTIGFGQALQFTNGGPLATIQNYFATDPSATLSLKTPYTIEGWVKYTTPSTDYPHTIFSRTSGTAHQYHAYDDRLGFDISQPYDPAKSPRLSYIIAENLPGTFGTSKIESNKWYHVAVVVNGDGVYLFTNGQLESKSIKPITNLTNPAQFFIGLPNEAPNTYASNGLVVDEVRISSTARYLNNFTPPTVPFTKDGATISLWHFDGNATDETGNNKGYIKGSLSYITSDVIPLVTIMPTPSCVPSEQFGCKPDGRGNIICVDPAPSTILCPPATPTPTAPPPPYTPTPSIRISPTPTPSLLMPDLTISGGITVTPSTQTIGFPTNIKFNITNIGTKESSAPYIYLSQSDGKSTIGFDNTCTASTILAPGKSCISSYNFTFPTIGAKYFTIGIDPYNQVPESNEANNKFETKTLIIAGTPTPTPRPTIILTSPTPTPRPTIITTPKPTIASTPMPTPTPAMCPAKLTSTSFSSPCRNIRTIFSREKGYRTVSYTCSDNFSGKISGQTCRLQSDLTTQATQACARRVSVCR